jgi:hypothetical protein
MEHHNKQVLAPQARVHRLELVLLVLVIMLLIATFAMLVTGTIMCMNTLNTSVPK